MNPIPFTVREGDTEYQFEVVDYVHHTGDRCQFEVFLNGALIAAFDPDPQQHLHLCKQYDDVDERVLHLLADKIESYEW